MALSRLGLRTPPTGARRGSLIVTTFMIVLGLTFVLAGVNTLLKEQMRQSLEIKTLTLGRLQAFYLAEMGVNRFMYEANVNGALPAPQTYDFRTQVAMTKNDPAAVATVAINADGPGRYEAVPTLQVGGESFSIPWRIRFNPELAADGHYVLARYEVIER